ncbi:cAMP-binding domain of CRP or a regulatory subunit of cAMP-dependent protein kinases [Soonwooa buanensis]|uniref:cAMP-binding domain of CRP or a regulatory subunit of cAMP-dependent protein kinases n=1 Tax=Soonwooa buanensis TaxID=619805 RepID=A0A1T5G707_9FLAO|nr:cyclic nucleotide-binding domain-containing protein [Soonwooa buanensis]SKC04178.1 cAMP-binding domain of CRP or a regulatory subunit of cAMP-dependent protein kinases [Soonwooa buanensis]
MNSEIFQNTYQHFLLSEEDINQIASFHKKRSFVKDELILAKDQVLESYYLLEKGVVRAFVNDMDNNDITTEFFIDGDIVIIPSSLFQQIPSQESLQAVTDCEVWEIKYDDFQEVFRSIPSFAEWGRLWFTYQLFTLKQRSLDMITISATNRYLKLSKEKPQILQTVPLKFIASFLGITDTSLSRIRKEIVRA